MQEPNTNSKQKQLKNLQEIGSRLQQVRIEKRLSLEEISAKTLIQTRLLRAIEQGQIEELPEPFYIKALITKFASSMGLNGSELANSFDLNVSPQKSPSQRKESTKISKSKPSWQLPSLPSLQFRLPFELRPYHLYIFYIFLIVMSVKVLANMVEPSTIQAEKEEQPQTTLQSSIAVNPSVEQESKSLNVSRSAADRGGKPVIVDISVKDRCWMRIMVDGKKEFEGLLSEGTRKTWVANDSLTIRAGNAGSVFVTFRDRESKQLGKPGEVQEVTYKADAKL
jgi:cytoskeletal protein RodZ